MGAYNNTQWLQFIEYRPNVVLVTETGDVELIREAEDLSDLERREHLPPRLADLSVRPDPTTGLQLSRTGRS